VNCAACGTQLRADAKFCDECGTSVSTAATTAEYKQVTVLFADVVHSMDIAAAVGPERLRELMSELFDRCADVVARYGGTVDKFTGDGMMAVFGAPVALEDHAIRACVAALGIQKEVGDLAVDVRGRDGVDLALRIGLNSGEVIAGEVGSRAKSYTTVGDQVGMAQRMESVAAPGGVMLTEATARIVEGEAVLGERQLVQIKGAVDPVAAYSLQSVTGRHFDMAARASTYVGREWELAALKGMLERSVAGHGSVVSVVGPPGIGKSRTVAEVIAHAEQLGMLVFSTYCESHTSDVAFQAAIRLLRSGFGVDGLTDEAARARLRSQAPDADPADVILLQDELGIRNPADELPDIAPDARRRRLTALVNATVLARDEPVVFVIEDAHWVDPTSEALLAEFVSVVPRTRSVAIVTYRPEYSGLLSRSTGAQTIALAPLDDSHIGSLIAESLGPHPSVVGLTGRIADRASGNPFFAEEIVRDLADRGVLRGQRGSHTCEDDAADVDVPPTVQAAIAARIDRLTPDAKQTLNAAAVIGLRFDEATLRALVDGAALAPLIEAELIDQVAFTPRPEFAFHHPLIRAVAHRSQLTSARAEVHRRLAAVLVGAGDPEVPGEQAALIAEHYESAGDLEEAFAWHMRAGEQLRFRDVHACRLSWQRASRVADDMPNDFPGRESMRIAPRVLLVASNFRAIGPVDDAGFKELRLLTDRAGYKLSLAMALSGRVTALAFRGRYAEALQEANELVVLNDSVVDPTWQLALLIGASVVKLICGDFVEGLLLADRMIEIADGDFLKGGLLIESPLCVAMMLRAIGRMSLGATGWKRDMDEAEVACREFTPVGESAAVSWKYGLCVAMGAVRVDPSAVGVVNDIALRAEQRGDDLAVETARFLLGFCLAQQSEPDRQRGLELLATAREAATQNRVIAAVVPMSHVEFAKEAAAHGDTDGAIKTLSSLFRGDAMPAAFEILVGGALVEILIERAKPSDLVAAQVEVDRLAGIPVEPGFVYPEIVLSRLRALLARARGDDAGYLEYKAQYLAAATEAGYEGHIAKAEAMA
jgi:adenylate cyclase